MSEILHKHHFLEWPMADVNEEIRKTIGHEYQEEIHDMLMEQWDIYIGFYTNQ